MLRANITNSDQHHNILYEKDGTPTFIDMGLAEILHKTWLSKKYCIEGFLKAIFTLIPPLMLDWAERELIPHPPLPPETEQIVQDYWPNWKAKMGKELADKINKAVENQEVQAKAMPLLKRSGIRTCLKRSRSMVKQGTVQIAPDNETTIIPIAQLNCYHDNTHNHKPPPRPPRRLWLAPRGRSSPPTRFS